MGAFTVSMLGNLAFSGMQIRGYIMKSILLASASVIAFAGVAAAEVTFSGSATLGYNTDDGPASGPNTGNDFNLTALGDDDNEGFYWDANIAVTLSQELDNGLTAGATFDFDVADGNNGQALSAGSYVLFIESDSAGLYFGDTAFAAETRWVSAGDMEADGFSEADGETAIRGDMTYGPVAASLSYVVANNAGTVTAVNDVDQLSLGVSADLGNFNVVVAYQEASGEAAGFYSSGLLTDGDNGDFNQNEIFGISVGTSIGGADIRLAYASDETANADSTGIRVSYPVGPVTLAAYYVSESAAAGDNWGINAAYANGPIAVALDYQDDQGVEKIGLEGSYDVGNGIMVMAGYLTTNDTPLNSGDRFYVAGTYDLGGGASMLVSYAQDDENIDGDEIGAGDYQRGTTVELTFEF